MLTEKLLRYYLECLKYESYYSLQLREEELAKLQINPEEPEKVFERYKELAKGLQEGQTIMFGYPLLQKRRGKQVCFMPLFLWSNLTFLSDRNMFKMDQIGLHKELFGSITDKYSLDALQELKENFKSSPRSFWLNQMNLDYILDCIDNEAMHLVYSFVIVKADNKNNSNYQIVKEIQAILDGKRQASQLLESYLSNSYALPYLDSERTTMHIVPSNYPQNIALEDIHHTVSIIKGPPGTGKTQTILNVIANQIGRRETCAVASTNNQAVNNISEKLESKGINKQFFGFVRLGNLSHNKREAIRIQNTIEHMREEVSTLLPDETYSALVRKSQMLMKQIIEVERMEQQIVDIRNTIDQLQSLISVLNDRLRLHHLTTMKEDFLTLSIASERVESRLRELVDEPLRLYGNGIFRKFRSFLAGKISFYMEWRVKNYFRSINAAQLWEYTDRTEPIHSIALCEEVVKVINLEHRLEQYKADLNQLQKRQREQPHDLKALYMKKNDIDLAIIRTQWLRAAQPILTNTKEMKSISSLIKELGESGRIEKSAPAFASFIKLFPVLLVSSLSARNCIPYGSSIDLVIIDEASQCSIPSVFSLLQSSRRACFFGDIHQLSHIVSLDGSLSKTLFDNCASGIEHSPYCFANVSAFERAEQACQQNERGNHLLSYHYRCIPTIASFSNQHFYRGRLRMMRKEPERELYRTGIFSTNVFGVVSGTHNTREIEEIRLIVDKLESNGVTHIGIVTPFASQKQKLSEAFRSKSNIQVGTVHTFQGGECQAIIFSTVISNGSTRFQINFVQNSYRLINVALTLERRTSLF
ncbi:AAA domain-containing protein [Paenibacillus dendritiformis]|uniref:AAA domain-containing protein n=1 Tax=Paenibacillus dendritiformis TaxID=130049 RepID=UPI00387E17A9